MENESFKECLVEHKGNGLFKFLQVLLITITVIFALIGLVNILFWILAVASGVGAYFAGMNANLEYEYLYMERELQVDKIMNKSRRKKVANYEVGRMEILAPFHSYHLDDFKNRQFDKVKDFSIGEELQPDRRYVLIYDGKEKIVLSPSEDMVAMIKRDAPRKVFTD
ncbi:MAG: DUF6106 family protein [Lachnospiraceae bacterium]|nr:DUF6106 family protein [Lachnospiraceae bacterium]